PVFLRGGRGDDASDVPRCAQHESVGTGQQPCSGIRRSPRRERATEMTSGEKRGSTPKERTTAAPSRTRTTTGVTNQGRAKRTDVPIHANSPIRICVLYRSRNFWGEGRLEADQGA